MHVIVHMVRLRVFPHHRGRIIIIVHTYACPYVYVYTVVRRNIVHRRFNGLSTVDNAFSLVPRDASAGRCRSDKAKTVCAHRRFAPIVSHGVPHTYRKNGADPNERRTADVIRPRARSRGPRFSSSRLECPTTPSRTRNSATGAARNAHGYRTFPFPRIPKERGRPCTFETDKNIDLIFFNSRFIMMRIG